MDQTTAIRIHPDGDPETGMSPAGIVAPDTFTTDLRHETMHTAFASADGRATAGVWECAPCQMVVEPFGIDEFMVMIEGSMTLTPHEGTPDHFKQGDAFLIPADFSGVIKVDELARAYWMVYQQPEGPSA
ncbi:MAG: cupin domain-containing protein [Paracoccaceae bacterium]